MTAGRRALDKIYKRRDRYEIPDWQRGKVWNTPRKQLLIDSILRGWKLPKFYLLSQGDDTFEVVDGQQRLTAIWEFFANELPLSSDSSRLFGGPYYNDLEARASDSFDDFEIEFDEIADASEEELKQFFQRLQLGLPLTSSEKLNSSDSNLRDFCKSLVDHKFFRVSIAVPDTRLAHFDIATKIAAIEVDGIGTSLRYDEIKAVFEAQKSFSQTSAAAKRMVIACDFLARAFPVQEPLLKNRTVVQSVITFTCRLIETGRSAGVEATVASFLRHFLKELAHQVELGKEATSLDYTRFQESINANVKAGARIRQEVLMRAALIYDPSFTDMFGPDAAPLAGLSTRAKELGESVAALVGRLNSLHAAAHGEDLFKATNKTAQALIRIGKPVRDLADYKDLLSDLYFLFRESAGQRLSATPPSFADVNTLRTDLQHDVDHGDDRKVRTKRRTAGDTFKRYSGATSPEVLDPSSFVLVQVKLLAAIEQDLRALSV
jgi:hypothetical protein